RNSLGPVVFMVQRNIEGREDEDVIGFADAREVQGEPRAVLAQGSQHGARKSCSGSHCLQARVTAALQYHRTLGADIGARTFWVRGNRHRYDAIPDLTEVQQWWWLLACRITRPQHEPRPRSDLRSGSIEGPNESHSLSRVVFVGEFDLLVVPTYGQLHL